MLRYIGKRLLALIPLLIIISVLSFLIIELPPGDYVTRYIADPGNERHEGYRGGYAAP